MLSIVCAAFGAVAPHAPLEIAAAALQAPHTPLPDAARGLDAANATVREMEMGCFGTPAETDIRLTKEAYDSVPSHGREPCWPLFLPLRRR